MIFGRRSDLSAGTVISTAPKDSLGALPRCRPIPGGSAELMAQIPAVKLAGLMA